MANRHIEEFGVLMDTGLPELSVINFTKTKHSGENNQVQFIYKTNLLTIFRRTHSMVLKRNQADVPHHILEGFVFVLRNIRNVTMTTTALKVSR